ncbi:hypothetical protein JCM5353_004606 [Sporobolomyces roseus]
MSLLTLPPELLSDIFHLAHEDDSEDSNESDEPNSSSTLTRDPICRTLLFFQREVLYREVVGLTSDQFELFIHTIIDNTQLGEFVHVLAAPWTTMFVDYSKEEVRTLLLSLTRVETLRIAAVREAAVTLLDKEFASSNLSNLAELEIGNSPSWSKAGPQEEDRLGNLALYPNLKSLALDTGLKTSEPSPPVQALTRISKLTLEFLRPEPEVNADFILDRFPNTCQLTLNSRDYHIYRFKSLLKRLTSSPHLSIESLSLLGSADFSRMTRQDVPDPCDDVFPSFSHLTYLYLAQLTFSPDVGTSLRQLPHLATLGFGRGAIMEEDRILALAVGHRRLPSLKKLILDQVREGSVGWSVQEEGEYRRLHPNHADDPRHVAPDWEKPEFDPYGDGTFTADGVEEMIDDCEGAGIEVEGTVIEALEFMNVWELEAEICEELWEDLEEGNHGEELLQSEDSEDVDTDAESEDDEEDDEI